MGSNDDPFVTSIGFWSRSKRKSRLHFHAEVIFEVSFGWYLDGRATAVVDTYLLTADETCCRRALPTSPTSA